MSASLIGLEAVLKPSLPRRACMHLISHEAAPHRSTYPYGFGNCREYDREMYCLDLLVLDMEGFQKKFGQVDRSCFGRVARDLGNDGLEELFPNNLRFHSFVEGARSNFHLGRVNARSFPGFRNLHPQNPQFPP